MIWTRRFHKWLGLAIGLQIILWMVSGLMMSLLDHEEVRGGKHRVTDPSPLAAIAPAALMEPMHLLESAGLAGAPTAVDLVALSGRALYRVKTADGVSLHDAGDGSRFEITANVAAGIAQSDYAGTGELDAVSRITAPTMEVRRYQGTVWRADFDDEANTSVYVSAADGAILERRNDSWRLFDLFWMLHIMDYAERENFNNALVIITGLCAAFFALSGIILLYGGFQKEDFLVLRPSFWRNTVPLTVCEPSGEVITRIAARPGRKLYDALADSGHVLPSNCGGGGTCGLCEVTVASSAAITEADRRLIPEVRLASGARLSCQARVSGGCTVQLPFESDAAVRRTLTVIAVKCLTPFIREISLEVPGPAIDYRAGSYIDVVIPPHRTAIGTLDVDAEVRNAWRARTTQLRAVNDVETRRAYSLASAAPDNPGRLILNVRLMLPRADAPDSFAGAGSTYLWSLRPGDPLDIFGPLGSFHAEPGASDMVVIGGGAGMAPLRAIIRDQLLHRQSTRRIDYWYGARTRADLFYVEELDELQANHENFAWQPVLSEPLESDGWERPKGLVHEAIHERLLRCHPDPGACEFFVCGPPLMIEATRRMLVGLGVPANRILFDDFGI